MKTTFKHALKAAAIATALAFSGAAHAAVDGDAYTQNLISSTMVNNFEGAMFSGFPVQVIDIYELTNNSNAAQSFLAFCIQPTIDLLPGTHYTSDYNAEVSYAVKSLFETSYKSVFLDGETVTADERKLAFQFALWDIEHDDGSMYAGTKQFFADDRGTEEQNVIVLEAERMLRLTDGYAVLGKYNYTLFDGVAGGIDSQQLVGVSAVPEADTWAMMAVGLGLVGFVGRRKSRKAEKFAA